MAVTCNIALIVGIELDRNWTRQDDKDKKVDWPHETNFKSSEMPLHVKLCSNLQLKLWQLYQGKWLLY